MRIACFSLSAAILAAAAAGCHREAAHPGASRPEQFDAAAWESPHVGYVGRNESIVVTEGPPPLVYQAMQSGPVHVADAAGGTVIARMRVKALDLVRVDLGGVYVGEQRVAAGALGADHRYRIYVDPDVEPMTPQGQ